MFARTASIGPFGTGWRETPTEAGRCLRGHGCSLACCQHSGRKTPTKVGRWLRRGRGDQFDVIGREKPPPEWGGVCEGQAASGGHDITMEKPPPKWGGVCETGTQLQE